MLEDQVWPQRSDFGFAGGFQELGLRFRDGCFFAALAFALAGARDPYWINLNLNEWTVLLGCGGLIGGLMSG